MKQRTFEEVLIPKQKSVAWLQRLGNMEFLDDQMFDEEDKISESWLHLTMIMSDRGFLPYII